jgi:hypothetical protein
VAISSGHNEGHQLQDCFRRPKAANIVQRQHVQGEADILAYFSTDSSRKITEMLKTRQIN